MLNGQSSLFQIYRGRGGGGMSLGYTFETKTAADYSNCWITTSLQEVGDSLVILEQSFVNQAVSVQNCR